MKKKLNSNQSEFTKKMNAIKWTLIAVDWTILLVPVIVYFFIGALGEGLVVQKVSLVAAFAVALILSIFNIIAKKHLRSILWILVLGIYIAVENILPLIICLAVATILDEFLFEPFIKKYSTKYESSLTDDQKKQYNEKHKKQEETKEAK